MPSPAPQLFQTPLRTSRQAYDDLRFAYLRSPDGRYPADISVPPSHGVGDRASQAAAPSGPTPSGVFDPLSLEDTSPWKKYYKDLEVKKEIRKDVERTYVSALCSPSKDACFAREADLQPPIAASLTCPTSRRITLGSCSRQFCSCIAHCTPTSRTGRYVLPSTTVGHAGPELTRGPFCVAHSAGHARTRSCHAAGCRTRLPSCCRWTDAHARRRHPPRYPVTCPRRARRLHTFFGPHAKWRASLLRPSPRTGRPQSIARLSYARDQAADYQSLRLDVGAAWPN